MTEPSVMPTPTSVAPVVDSTAGANVTAASSATAVGASALTPTECRRARLARDARFDGRFFIGVSTTGIFCRPICAATPPLEHNVRYFDSAIAAVGAGFRPCLRCRPDSAPGSSAWRGVETTLTRALRLIHEGELQRGSVGGLCSRLGISERYLRHLFQHRFGVAPKAYALYRQCLFAKQLLHQTTLPVTRIAYASGFSSLRRFNDAFKRQMTIAPTDIRRDASSDDALTLKLSYRPPYAWERLRHFHRLHVIDGLEWINEHAYGRTLLMGAVRGEFTAVHVPAHHRFDVTVKLDDLSVLDSVVQRIRQVLDLDADITTIENHLQSALPTLALQHGLRIPGLWSPFEAGVRGILGQHVSIAAATRLIQRLVDELGDGHANREADAPGTHDASSLTRRDFPTPEAVAQSDLAFLGMPARRRETLIRFASAYRDAEIGDDPDDWTQLKGIGPWTAAVARFRGLNDPDVWLAGDVGIKRALRGLESPVEPTAAAPWRSYLTLQLWNAVI
ncbi:DNA-3-methyladenine glycosylase 2 family protein [Salinicola aestuarinus]|uniref:DNA-3-methyladenine glycosylase 2 family protein n=1 Tax=Salinicola aestuarinus TaxID=1949082 RepID=UPI001FD9CE84|nr:AlkA N-terminal domain-containing protein [Salinicola aestuarinus]